LVRKTSRRTSGEPRAGQRNRDEVMERRNFGAVNYIAPVFRGSIGD
jgi:hypothetical protein